MKPTTYAIQPFATVPSGECSKRCGRRHQKDPAFLELGASKRGNEHALQLRFATEEEAEECRQHLIRRFPSTDDVWMVRRDIAMQEFGGGED